MASDDPDIAEVAAAYTDDIFVGLERGMAARRTGVIPDDRVVDVQFQDFIGDPLATVRTIYATLDRTLTAEVETAMRDFLAQNPGDGGGGGSRYRFSDTGLDEAVIRDRGAEYQSFYGVETEPIP